jgi:hypothetical protein
MGDKRQSVHLDWAGPKHHAEMDHKGVAPVRAGRRDPLQSPQNPELTSYRSIFSSTPPRVHIEKLPDAERAPILKKGRRRAGSRRERRLARNCRAARRPQLYTFEVGILLVALQGMSKQSV